MCVCETTPVVSKTALLHHLVCAYFAGSFHPLSPDDWAQDALTSSPSLEVITAALAADAQGALRAMQAPNLRVDSQNANGLTGIVCEPPPPNLMALQLCGWLRWRLTFPCLLFRCCDRSVARGVLYGPARGGGRTTGRRGRPAAAELHAADTGGGGHPAWSHRLLDIAAAERQSDRREFE